MRRSLVVVALCLAGCGGSGDDGPASVVPKDAAAYVAVDMNAEIAAELPHRSWVGERAALFALGDDTALVLETGDEKAAAAYAREPSVEQAYPTSAIVDGHLVLATDDALVSAAREAADGESFAIEEDEGLAAYVTAEHGADAAAPLAALGIPEPVTRLLPDGRLSARVRADGRATTIDVEGVEGRRPWPALDAVPASAWLAISDSELGDLVLAAKAAVPVVVGRLERRLALDLGRDLTPQLAAGTFFVQKASLGDQGRLVVDVRDEPALRRAAMKLTEANRRGLYGSVNRNRPGAAEKFLQFGVSFPLDGPAAAMGDVFVDIQHGHMTVDFGTTGGDAEDILDTVRYRDAERRLGGAPTLLVDFRRFGGRGYLAVRHADGLRIVVAGRIPNELRQ